MGRYRHTAEEIAYTPRGADVELARDSRVAGVCELLAISEQTSNAWRREQAGGPRGGFEF